MVALKVPVPFVIMVVGLVSSMPVILARKWLFSFSAATAITALMQSKARTANQSFFIVFLSLVVKKCQVSRIDLLRGDPRNLSLKNPVQGFGQIRASARFVPTLIWPELIFVEAGWRLNMQALGLRIFPRSLRPPRAGSRKDSEICISYVKSVCF